MNAKTLQNMQYFIGKVCTIVTTSMNRSFDERVAREHFAVRIGEITVDGIWGTHPYNEEMVSFFAMPHLISIHEEIELNPDNPEHAQMIEEYEKKMGKKVKSDIKEPPKKAQALPVLNQMPPVPENTSGDATFVDIESLERLAEDTKRAFHQYDSFDLRPK